MVNGLYNYIYNLAVAACRIAIAGNRTHAGPGNRTHAGPFSQCTVAQNIPRRGYAYG